MGKEYWTYSEVVEIFQVEESLLSELEEEEIICPTCPGGSSAKVFSTGDLENLRLVKILMEDMGVNLPGVEVVLRMRQGMVEMRRQFDDILEDLAGQIKRVLEEPHK